jgi:hypothetical protein
VRRDRTHQNARCLLARAPVTAMMPMMTASRPRNCHLTPTLARRARGYRRPAWQARRMGGRS